MSETIPQFPPMLPRAVVNDGITDLASQTFDRLAPHFPRYLEDERRKRGEDGATLTADNESVLWEGGAYGKIQIAICDRSSLKQVALAFNSDPEVRRATVNPLSSKLSHYEFIKNSKDLSGSFDDERYTIGGVALLLHVARDRYPDGVVDARESLWADDRDKGQYPETAYGERHKVGIELVTRYDDVVASGRPAIWRFGMSVQTRFDKPQPQWEMKSEFCGLVDTFDIGRMGYGRSASFQPKIRQARNATVQDVEAMERFFGLAKNIRPRVTPIEKFLKERSVISAMAEEFFGSDEPAKAET